jgi:hypothetical protein
LRRKRSRNPFANLRTFAEFRAHEESSIPCCRFVSKEDAEAGREEGVYDCGSCVVAEQWTALASDPQNADAYRIFQQTVNRFTVDTHTAATILERLTEHLGPVAYADLIDRLGLLYDVLCPAPERKES